MWVFATRSRLENCKRFIKAWNETSASSKVFLRLDNCDPILNDLLSLPWPSTFEVVVGEREGLREALQEMYEKYPQEPWYGFLADDVVPRTKHWDQFLIDTAGKKYISYPNDLGGKPKRPSHPIVGGDLVRAVGWFGLPGSKHLYLDTAWQSIGESLKNLKRMDEVIVEHVHPFWNKANSDRIYAENKQRSKNDKENYLRWLSSEFPSLIVRLKKDFENDDR